MLTSRQCSHHVNPWKAVLCFDQNQNITSPEALPAIYTCRGKWGHSIKGTFSDPLLVS
jgi:hypothetical protein